jgi:hypothetical protein
MKVSIALSALLAGLVAASPIVDINVAEETQACVPPTFPCDPRAWLLLQRASLQNRMFLLIEILIINWLANTN